MRTLLINPFWHFTDDCSVEDGVLIVGEQQISGDLDDAEACQQIASLCLGQRLENGVIMHGGFFLGRRLLSSLAICLTINSI